MMNADELVHAIKQASAQQQDNRFFAYGHIAAYDDTLHRVQVTFPALRDDNAATSDGNPVYNSPPTAWMPLASLWVGDGFGMQIAPIGGELCLVELITRQTGIQVCAHLLYNAAMPPPGSVAPGEALFQHKSGSFLKFHANGDIETNTQGNVILASAANVNVTATANVNITASGAVSVTAPSISLGSSGEGLLDALTSAAATLYNSHTHSGVQTGGGTTGTPNQTMGSGQMTSVVKVG